MDSGKDRGFHPAGAPAQGHSATWASHDRHKLYNELSTVVFLPPYYPPAATCRALARLRLRLLPNYYSLRSQSSCQLLPALGCSHRYILDCRVEMDLEPLGHMTKAVYSRFLSTDRSHVDIPKYNQKKNPHKLKSNSERVVRLMGLLASGGFSAARKNIESIFSIYTR